MFRNDNNLAIFVRNSCFTNQEKRPFILLKEFSKVNLSQDPGQL